MDEERPSALQRLLAKKLAGIQLTAPETEEADYDAILAHVIRRARAMSETVSRNRARVEDRYLGLVDQPEDRQQAVLANSSPPMLLALAYGLMRESYAHRFDDVQRSLALAKLAHDAAKAVAETEYLSPGSASDLMGESLGYLANALRLNADLAGANRALADAEEHLEAGTRDRQLRADYLSFLASLRHTEGRCAEAARVQDREIPLRRLIGDGHRLGTALMDRGLIACYAGEPLREASDLILEGCELVEDDRMIFLGVLHLAEAFAREGDGVRAWKLLCGSDITAILSEVGSNLLRRQRWVKGITYRALGEPDTGARLLESVRQEFEELEQPLFAAFVSLDLLAVLAALEKHAELVPLAEATYQTFVTEGLGQQALSVFMIARRAAASARLTEELAVKVANFVMRHRHNREARFE